MLSFQSDIDAFERALPGLLADDHKGEFAVLKNSNVQKVLPTYEQALSWGYEQYGLDDQFFVKQVQDSPEQVVHFRRLR